jgi:hypothetical protein
MNYHVQISICWQTATYKLSKLIDAVTIIIVHFCRHLYNAHQCAVVQVFGAVLLIHRTSLHWLPFNQCTWLALHFFMSLRRLLINICSRVHWITIAPVNSPIDVSKAIGYSRHSMHSHVFIFVMTTSPASGVSKSPLRKQESFLPHSSPFTHSVPPSPRLLFSHIGADFVCDVKLTSSYRNVHTENRRNMYHIHKINKA